MKAEELMVGDWVLLPEVFLKRETKVTDVGLCIEVEDSAGVYGFEELSPIPLTPKILEKNGFRPYIPEGHLETVYACQDVSKAVAAELYALWPYRDGSFYLLLRVDGKDMVRMDVHYIHQLQHALRLCGIDKEIEL